MAAGRTPAGPASRAAALVNGGARLGRAERVTAGAEALGPLLAVLALGRGRRGAGGAP
ncbi:hypothetical protein OOK41_23315 [Micromonospora sp. NBC_01655]|uniref:hypothetical protein n=1 Tax=Micromonospora sp. NBC_01655 TaxID=2975983 RepID=UPI0022531FE8|nr:hypothetical protein [Micromonospora sp. NBC_01655]MCX4473199.1 hypothetical protein [Micromonospora sp. NBC_01655]